MSTTDWDRAGPAHRAASDVAGDLDDGFHLGRLLERRGVDRIAALVDIEGLLLAAHRLGGDGFGHQGRGGQIALMPGSPDAVGPSGAGDRLHAAVVVDAADEGVEAPHQIASGLVEGALGQILNQGIEPLGGGKESWSSVIEETVIRLPGSVPSRSRRVGKVGLLLHRA